MSPISPLLYIAIYFGFFLALVSVGIGSFILYKGGYITSLFDASKNNHDLQKVIQAKKFVSTMRNRSFSDKETEQELYHFGYDKTIVDAAMKS